MKTTDDTILVQKIYHLIIHQGTIGDIIQAVRDFDSGKTNLIKEMRKDKHQFEQQVLYGNVIKKECE
jgi:hypothetical protein